MRIYDLIILGAGPAGLSAAIYASRYNLDAIVVGKDMGMITETAEVENYLGLYPVTGLDLAKKFAEHAKKTGTEIIYDAITDVSKLDDNFLVRASKKEFRAKSIIYALGGIKRRLGLKEEEKLIGKGISYCATCDAPLFRDKVVAVAGGANAAAGAAILLSEFATKVYIIYRREKLRATPSLVKRLGGKQNTEVIYSSVIKKVNGKDFVESVNLENLKDNKKSELNLNGIFVEFGSIPNSEFAEKLGVLLTDDKRITVNEDMSTNVKGFFAVGDVTSGSNRFDQIITAASEGAIAADSVYKFLENKRSE